MWLRKDLSFYLIDMRRRRDKTKGGEKYVHGGAFLENKKIGKTPAVVKRVFTLHVDIAEANNVLQPFWVVERDGQLPNPRLRLRFTILQPSPSLARPNNYDLGWIGNSEQHFRHFSGRRMRNLTPMPVKISIVICEKTFLICFWFLQLKITKIWNIARGITDPGFWVHDSKSS